jgi:hypothetical protein
MARMAMISYALFISRYIGIRTADAGFYLKYREESGCIVAISIWILLISHWKQKIAFPQWRRR